MLNEIFSFLITSSFLVKGLVPLYVISSFLSFNVFSEIFSLLTILLVSLFVVTLYVISFSPSTPGTVFK